jgi:hypothetical protein
VNEVTVGSRLAVLAADEAFHVRLRARFGLAPSVRALDPPRGLAYCGSEFRVYPFMRIADAVRFFSAIHDRWDAERLEADFELARLDGSFEIRRMKRAYQRALVLALAAAAAPTTLVVERGEEFDDGPPLALLARAVERAPAALVTFGGETCPGVAAGTYTAVLSASAFEAQMPL